MGVTIDDIKKAREVLDGVARKTDLIYSPALSGLNQIYLKTENLQLTGSFKLRGAYNKINALSDEEKDYLNMGFKGLYNKLHYGFQDWYDWRWANWGTKWNSCDSEFQDNAIFISTAWSMPFPVIKKLSELLKSEITIIYADEDFGCNTGRLVFNNGEVLENYNPAICSGDAFVCVYEAWDYEYEISKHENGEPFICFDEQEYLVEQFTEKLS